LENNHAQKILEMVIKMRETAELNERIAALETHLAMPHWSLKRAAVSTVLRSRSEKQAHSLSLTTPGKTEAK
jgi:hypothetical protein